MVSIRDLLKSPKSLFFETSGLMVLTLAPRVRFKWFVDGVAVTCEAETVGTC